MAISTTTGRKWGAEIADPYGSPYLDIRTLASLVSGGDWRPAFSAAFANSRYVYAPAGTYPISYISIPANKTLITDGKATIFQKLVGVSVGFKMLTVSGSNVELGTLTVIGDIAGESSEQSHAIFIQANSATGNIENVKIGDVYASDIRGDAVYIGQAAGYSISGVTVGTIYPDNCYRNAISIVSGDAISVAGVEPGAVGFYTSLIEPNVGSGPARNIRFGIVRGDSFGIYGPTTADYVENVHVDVLDLSTDLSAVSSPTYAPITNVDGIATRNVNNMRIGTMTVDGINRYGIYGTFTSGDLDVQTVDIGTLKLRGCSEADAVNNAFTNFGPLRCHIGALDVVTPAGKTAVWNLANSSIGRARMDIGSGGSAFKACDSVAVDFLDGAGSGTLLTTSTDVKILTGSSAN